MQSKDIYLGQDSLESIAIDIEASLNNGANVATIVKSLIGSDKAELIITKWYGGHKDEFSQDEQIDIITQYINEHFADHIKKSCVSDVIKKIIEKHYYGLDIDDYSEFLTELLNDGAYQKVNHHITNIMASYEPYMRQEHSKKFEKMTTNEHEVAIIDFIKENLCVSFTKKPVIKKDENNKNV